jgi:hypothetical protein
MLKYYILSYSTLSLSIDNALVAHDACTYDKRRPNSLGSGRLIINFESHHVTATYKKWSGLLSTFLTLSSKVFIRRHLSSRSSSAVSGQFFWSSRLRPPSMRALTLIALVPFALGQQYMLNLDCSDYPGPCNNDCYAIYVANKPRVWKDRLAQEEIWALTSFPRSLTTMGPMVSLTHVGGRLVVFPLRHVATARWTRRVLTRTLVTSILTRPLSKAAVEHSFGAPSRVRTRQRVVV